MVTYTKESLPSMTLILEIIGINRKSYAEFFKELELYDQFTIKFDFNSMLFYITQFGEIKRIFRSVKQLRNVLSAFDLEKVQIIN